MTDPARAERRDQLHEEAALWFARMRGEAAETHRAEFERWLARGALHRSAYNRIAEVFSGGKVLKRDKPAVARREARLHLLAAAAAGAVVTGLAALALWTGQPSSLAAPRIAGSEDAGQAPQQVATLLGERRRVTLADGTAVLLDRDTLVTIILSPRERLLRLERGRARFEVAHEPRPFRVRASDAVITAYGTVFDVALDAAPSVDIHLVRGAIGVRAPSLGSGAEAMLRAGQSLALTQTGGQVLRSAADDWPVGRRTFRRARLDAVLDAANRGALRKVTLADPALGAVRLSGTFRIDDADRLARQLGALLALEAVPVSDGISLRRQAGK